MNELTSEQKAARSRQVLRIVLFSFFGTVGMQAFLAWLTVGRESVPHGTLEGAVRHPMAIPFALAAVGFAAGSFVLKKLLSGPGRGSVDPRVPKEFGATLVAFALAEAPSVLGFVLASVTRSFGIGVPFFCLAALLLLLHFPKP